MAIGDFEIFEQFSESVVAVKEGVVVYCNAAAKKLLGSSAEGAEAVNILPPELLAESNVGVFLCSLHGRNIAASRVSQNGVLVFSFVVLDSGEKKPEFVSSMLYSVRELTATLSLVVRHLAGRIPPGNESYIAMFYQSYYRLLRLASNLAGAFNLSEGGVLITETEDVADICRKMSASVSRALEGKNIKIQFMECAPILMQVDINKFEHMIYNVVSNSIGSMKNGTIQISLDSTSDGVTVTVTDNGSGIPTTALRKITSGKTEMEPGSTTGAGFGLRAAMNVAELHGGRMILESREGIGTTVKIFIPQKDSSVLRTPAVKYAYSERANLLVGLADVLDSSSYLPKYIID